MIALRLVRLTEDHSDELSETLLEKFRQSPRTADFARVPAQELHDRIHELLQHLGDWLLHKQERDIEFRYREIGLRRSAQQVSLSNYSWAFLITKEHISGTFCSARASCAAPWSSTENSNCCACWTSSLIGRSISSPKAMNKLMHSRELGCPTPQSPSR
jgi:hypothetical protein